MMARVSGTLMTIRVPLPSCGIDGDAAVELADLGFDHIHAHAASGHIGNLVTGGKTGHEDDVVTFGIGQAIGRILVEQAFFNRLLAQRSGSMPAPSSSMVSRIWSPSCSAESVMRPTRGLPLRFPFVRRLDTVIDRVAHQVHQGIRQGLDQVLVQVGVFTLAVPG